VAAPSGQPGAAFASGRLPCQVCGRQLVPLRDGTSRGHTPVRRGTGGMDGARCKGSGYRLARWPIGQHLQHHTGSVWRIVGDRGRDGDYLIRCVQESWLEGPSGKEMTVHGEYMHRHGWTPLTEWTPIEVRAAR